jgi:hypothetical protein
MKNIPPSVAEAWLYLLMVVGFGGVTILLLLGYKP